MDEWTGLPLGLLLVEPLHAHAGGIAERRRMSFKKKKTLGNFITG
jgi:hypothetical protein